MFLCQTGTRWRDRVPEPKLIRLNRELAAKLSIDADWLESADGVSMLAGNAVPEGAEPIAQAYAGHQFCRFVPQLGDGRAILLGEVVDTNGARHDLQLKGSGRTPFSRGGDGKSALGPVIREYIVSEAMAALGVPTTRALAAVTTGERGPEGCRSPIRAAGRCPGTPGTRHRTERADQPVGPEGSQALAETCQQAVGDLERLLSALPVELLNWSDAATRKRGRHP